MLAHIKLPDERPLFAACNFQNNDPAVMDDDLGLSSYINQSLSFIASRSTDSGIAFISTSASLDAWLLVGRYDIKGKDVTVKVNMKKNCDVKNRFEITGKKNNLQELAENVVKNATEWIEKN